MFWSNKHSFNLVDIKKVENQKCMAQNLLGLHQQTFDKSLQHFQHPPLACAAATAPSCPDLLPLSPETIKQSSATTNTKKGYAFETDRDDTNIVTTGTNCSVTSSQVSLILWVIPRWTSQKLQRPWRRLPHLKGEHLEQAWTSQPAPILPQRQVLGSHMVRWKYLVHPNTPNAIIWTIVVGCTGNQVLQRSPIQALLWP